MHRLFINSQLGETWICLCGNKLKVPYKARLIRLLLFSDNQLYFNSTIMDLSRLKNGTNGQLKMDWHECKMSPVFFMTHKLRTDELQEQHKGRERWSFNYDL